ncbi:MAG: hypothetical protein PHR68_02940 [Candidatus Gracilibacteria bacterium]|nr:hypothetical protein [Candidatus Gracilibacteria bacterium]
MEYTKLFSQINELSEENQKEFKDFSNLNKILENNPIFQYNEIYNSYIEIILNNKNYLDFSELDYQIKYLIEEKGVSVNKILEFAKMKFGKIEDILSNFLKEKVLFLSNTDDNNIIENIIKDIYKKKTGNIQFQIIFTDKNKTDEVISIAFDINGDQKIFLDKLNKAFSKYDFMQLINGEIKGISMGLY